MKYEATEVDYIEIVFKLFKIHGEMWTQKVNLSVVIETGVFEVLPSLVSSIQPHLAALRGRPVS